MARYTGSTFPGAILYPGRTSSSSGASSTGMPSSMRRRPTSWGGYARAYLSYPCVKTKARRRIGMILLTFHTWCCYRCTGDPRGGSAGLSCQRRRWWALTSGREANLPWSRDGATQEMIITPVAMEPISTLVRFIYGVVARVNLHARRGLFKLTGKSSSSVDVDVIDILRLSVNRCQGISYLLRADTRRFIHTCSYRIVELELLISL